jgi:hypothetical protein
MQSFFGIVAGIISLAAFVPYILSILRGETKPNRASWLIWTVVGGMLAVSYRESGAGDAIWVPVSYVVGPLATFIASLRYNDGEGWSGLNKLCIIASAGSFVLWLVLFSFFGKNPGVPLTVMYINIFIDGMGALPTLRKSFHEPESEDRLTWALFITGNTLNLLAVDYWSVETGSYPLYMFVVSGMIAFLVISRFGVRFSGVKI